MASELEKLASVVAFRPFHYDSPADLLVHGSPCAFPMLLDFEVHRFTRHCAVSERKLQPGEEFFSVLQMEGSQIVRKDFSTESWQGPPSEVFAWWKSRVPVSENQRPKLAPNEVLLDLFDKLADQPANQDMRYVLTLLLVRRRVLRQEENDFESNDLDTNCIIVTCPQRNEIYQVPEIVPSTERIESIQAELTNLLYADTE